MHTHLRNRVALVAGTVIVGLSVAGVAAAQPATTPATPATTDTTAVTAQATPVVESERGIVLEASGTSGDLTASVTVYENSLHGNSVQVVLGDDLIGYTEGSAPFVVDGSIDVSVDVDGTTATLTGTITTTGRPEKIVEPVQDGGEQIVTRGTHTQLIGDLALTYDGVTVPLQLDTAFRYDLEVRKVALYGR